MLSHEKSLLATNQAYQLATNWLTAVDVDMAALEKTSKWEVRQRWFYGDKDKVVLLPVFYVRWGEWDEARVEVLIDGRNKGLLELRLMDHASFSRRSPELVKDLDKLLAIPDEEFKKYSPQERSNLLARFVVNWPIQNQAQTTNQTLYLVSTNATPRK